jgi:hypothetical protein
LGAPAAAMEEVPGRRGENPTRDAGVLFDINTPAG